MRDSVDGPPSGAGDDGASTSRAMNPTPFRSHWWPRTASGRLAVVLYVGLFVLCMPPVTHTVWDQPDRWVGGIPAFFVALFVVYVVLIGVLVWAWRKEL